MTTFLRRFLPAAPGRSKVVLSVLSRGFIQRARALREHANLAPNHAARRELADLAGEEEALGRDFVCRLEDLGARLDSEGGTERTATGAEPAGPNHWARLVWDLDRHRESQASAQEAQVRLGGREPRLAAVLAQLARAEQVHTARLRGLIARADPQALD